MFNSGVREFLTQIQMSQVLVVKAVKPLIERTRIYYHVNVFYVSESKRRHSI